MSSAQVYSLQRLTDFQAAVHSFVDRAKEAMSGNAMAARRALDWLEGQFAQWKTEIRRAEEAVVAAKLELARRKMMHVGDRPLDTTEQEKNLRRAQARLDHAEEKRDNTKAWLRKLPDDIEEYDGLARPFQDALEFDLAGMPSFLAQRLAALEAYRSVQKNAGEPS